MNPLDNYKIEQTIGKGTFGKVFGGIHRPTQQRVAIKILEKSRIESEADFTRIKREIHILRKIRHPNIVQLYEILESETKIYLIMEFIEGGELFQKIVKSKRLNENEAQLYFAQIINALEYMHSLKIAHRDLKPENLLLTEQNKIKVVDFGLSNLYTDKLQTPCGSPCYAAPEMVSGLSYYGLKTDIWACGIILYAMLCGCVPFEDPNTRKLYEKIKTSDFVKPAYLSGLAQDLLIGLLKKDPEQRITIQQIKQHPFISSSIKLGQQLNPKINSDIINQMVAKGQDESKIREMLLNNKHNSTTTTYYLLLIQLDKQSRCKTFHQPTKSLLPLSSERKPPASTLHTKTKSSENTRPITNENRRVTTEADQIKIQTYLDKNRQRTISSQEYSTFRALKPHNGSQTKRQNSKSPQMYIDYKVKTFRQY